MKRKLRKADILRLVVLLIALSLLLYPTISNYLYERYGSHIVDNYDENINQSSEKEKALMLKEAREYNKRLAENQPAIGDGFSQSNVGTKEYNRLLKINDAGMMGYIRIPLVDEEIPLYHGVDDQILQVGIGHIMESSLPVGGKSTHAVLIGHSGLPSKLLFTHLEELKKGNIFYIRILDKTFAYKVDNILTVLPNETESLYIVPGKDYVTLVTCTPYGQNTHRLLVRGKRVPYNEAVKIEPNEIDYGIKIPFEIKVLLISLLILLIILVVIKKHVRNRKKWWY